MATEPETLVAPADDANGLDDGAGAGGLESTRTSPVGGVARKGLGDTVAGATSAVWGRVLGLGRGWMVLAKGLAPAGVAVSSALKSRVASSHCANAPACT